MLILIPYFLNPLEEVCVFEKYENGDKTGTGWVDDNDNLLWHC